MSSEARFHDTNVGYVYSRYKRVGSTEMDESFFPVLWTEDGYRSGFLDEHLGVASEWVPQCLSLSTMSGGRTLPLLLVPRPV